MDYDDPDISNKSQMITLALLLFFGSLGAHRFYVGKYITGAMYLIIGSTQLVFKIFGFDYALIAQVVFALFILVDLYALYSDSFTDNKGCLVLGKEKTLVYESFEERDRDLFVAKLNKIVLVFTVATVYILYLVISNII